jgi:chemotaxis protein MotB
MQQAGLRADQVSQVRGFADQSLRNKADPLDASNRRISIIVQYITPAAEPREKSEDTSKPAGEAGETKPSGETKDVAIGSSEKSEKNDKK